jgi:hypothetical protein
MSLSGTLREPPWIAGQARNDIDRWIFEFTWKDGGTGRIEELAHQRWEGEKIAREQFFYDPRQFVPGKPAG